MADTTLVSVGDLKSWASPNADSLRDDELQACLNRAVSWIERQTNRTLESASFTEYFDGSKGLDTICLKRGRSPVIYTPLATPAVTVTITEDGTALTVAQGYSTTADVILSGVNEDRPCYLIRQSGPWSSGIQNIAAAYTAGWTSATVPAAVAALILEVAQLIFMSPNWLGKASASHAGNAVSFEKDLSPSARGTLESLMVHS